MSLEKIERNGLEKLGKRIAGSEQQAKQLVQRVLAVLGFRVVHESWGMYMETADGKCDVFFEDMPAFSASWSSILGKLVACKEICMESIISWTYYCISCNWSIYVRIKCISRYNR